MEPILRSALEDFATSCLRCPLQPNVANALPTGRSWTLLFSLQAAESGLLLCRSALGAT